MALSGAGLLSFRGKLFFWFYDSYLYLESLRFCLVFLALAFLERPAREGTFQADARHVVSPGSSTGIGSVDAFTGIEKRTTRSAAYGRETRPLPLRSACEAQLLLQIYVFTKYFGAQAELRAVRSWFGTANPQAAQGLFSKRRQTYDVKKLAAARAERDPHRNGPVHRLAEHLHEQSARAKPRVLSGLPVTLLADCSYRRREVATRVRNI